MSKEATAITIVRDSIIAELRRQEPKVYFWDRADEGLFAGGEQEWSEYSDRSGVATILLADRFDMDAVARAVMEALNV